MADNNTSSSVATAPVAEQKPKKPRSAINQVDARKLATAETVGQAAQHEDRVDLLDSREISQAFITSYLDKVEAARSKASEVLQKRTASKEATQAGTDAEKALIASLREVQKAAKQKYGRTNRIALADYLVGKKLNGNKPNLAQTSQTIVDKLAGDKLPGFTPAKVKAVDTLRTSWMDKQAAQVAAQSTAEDSGTEFKALLKTITDEKLAIQLAADAEWPHENHDHSGVRKEFALPARRPAKV